MKSEAPAVWKRLSILGLLMLGVLWVLDQVALKSRTEEIQNQLVLKALEGNKDLSDEINVVFRRIQDDFNFFEDRLLRLIQLPESSEEYRTSLDILLSFLHTHPGYFKVRLTDQRGQEIFKLIESPDHSKFVRSRLLYDLSRQRFYQNLNKVRGEGFYFSSMEPNIINGRIERPLRPTVRISRRVRLADGKTGLLIFNIDGEKILTLFSEERVSHMIGGAEKALLDGRGQYVASFPQLERALYTQKRKSAPKVFRALMSQKDLQGTISFEDSIIVYSKIVLPRTDESWFLITRLPGPLWAKDLYKDRLTWLFWGLLFFVIVMIWFWKQEQKRYKDEVVKVLLTERNEFIQNVTHQLKTPLAILLNTLNKEDPSKEDWQDIKKDMNHLIKIVDDMLLLALVEANPIIPVKDESVLELVSAAIEMTGAKAKEKGVTIRVNVDEKIYEVPALLERPVMGDLFISALMNLIDNALDFSPRGDTVDIGLSSHGQKVVIQVKDNGPGIPEELVPRLFGRFVRGSSESGRKGTGLGLSIAKKIIDLHHGEIKVVKFTHGTTIEVHI